MHLEVATYKTGVYVHVLAVMYVAITNCIVVDIGAASLLKLTVP